MSNFDKQIFEEKQKIRESRKVAMIVFWFLMPLIAYVGVQIWAGILQI